MLFEEEPEDKFLRWLGIVLAVAAALWLGSYLVRSAQNAADAQALQQAIDRLPQPPK